MSSGDLLREVRVAPSILSADFARLGVQVEEVLAAGARVIHVDVMDGHFVPSITLGPIVVGALRELVEQVGAMLDVHLMIERPERMIPEFLKAGAHSITFHAEATPHIAYTASLVHEGCASVGVAINPATPVGAVAELPDAIDLVLCMTVNPGWGDSVLSTLARQDRTAAPHSRQRRRQRCRARGRRRHRHRHRRLMSSSGRKLVRCRLGDLRRARSGRGLSPTGRRHRRTLTRRTSDGHCGGLA